MIYSTYYTPEYTEIVRRLVDSADRFDLDVVAVPTASGLSWQANVRKKLDILLSLRQTLIGDLVFFDADAEILADPTEEFIRFGTTNSSPIAMTWYPLRNPKGTVTHPITGETGRGHAGTILIRDDREALVILKSAMQIMRNLNTGYVAPEEYALCVALNAQGVTGCYDLPRTLCHIPGKPIDGEPLIIQHQASKTMRKAVGS